MPCVTGVRELVIPASDWSKAPLTIFSLVDRETEVTSPSGVRCDRSGHFARDCPEWDTADMDKENRDVRREARGPRDLVVKDRRDMKDPRDRDYGWGGGLKCYKCKGLGHFAKSCRAEEGPQGQRDRCYRCQSSGHIARNCTQDGDQPVCYNCNKVGHILKDCPNAGTKTCYKCGGIGHILKDCPSRV